MPTFTTTMHDSLLLMSQLVVFVSGSFSFHLPSEGEEGRESEEEGGRGCVCENLMVKKVVNVT